MSEPFDIDIEFEVPLSRNAVAGVLNAVRATVRENWTCFADKWSEPEPDMNDELPEKTVDRVLRELESRIPTAQYGICSSDVVPTRFSPVSKDRLELTFRNSHDGLLRLVVWLRQGASYDVAGTREADRMEWEWEAERIRRGKQARPLFEPPQDGEMDEDTLQEWNDRYYALHQTPSVWPQNRQCLLNIVERLKRALPVKTVELDLRLLETPAMP